MEPSKSLKRKNSDTLADDPIENSESDPKTRQIKKSKRVKLDSIQVNESIVKNSVQLLHEIKLIQPIIFEMLSSEGPAHKQIFKFRLKFKLEENIYEFYGEGNSKKKAKTVSAMRGLMHLANLETFFSNVEKEYLKSIVNIDMKSLSINENIENYFSSNKSDYLVIEKFKKIPEIPDTVEIDLVNKIDFVIKKEIDCEILVDEEKNNPKLSEANLNMPESNIDISIENEEKNFKFNFDKKTKEIISTKNCLTIINHLISTNSYSFNLLNESGMSHSKIFKIQLNIKKKAILGHSNEKFVQSLSNKVSLFFFTDEDHFKFIGSANSIRVAKKRSAELALETIFGINLISSEKDVVLDEKNGDSNSDFKFFADNISELVKNKFDDLINLIEQPTNVKPSESLNEEDATPTIKNKLRNVYAAIIQSEGLDYKTSKLICVTTGTKCISGECMSQIGAALNDCHAEILAIRFFRKYLYTNLTEFISTLDNSSNDDSSLFQLLSSNESNVDSIPKKLFRINKKFKFHLFISSAPCGDGRIFSLNDNIIDDNLDNHPNRKVRGLLRTKLEAGEGTVPINCTEPHLLAETWDSILIGNRLKVMSCSDKICKYNVLGVQGALLSTMLETVYLDSIIIGDYYHKNHLARAVYGRIANNIKVLPDGFILNKPILSSITNSYQRKIAKSSNKSIIWSDAIKNVLEIINCKEGKTIQGIPSLVCKMELFKNWITLYKTIKNNPQLSDKINFEYINQNQTLDYNVDANNFFKELTYKQAKLFAIDYQTAKLNMYKAFKNGNLGLWILKPFETNYFTSSFF